MAASESRSEKYFCNVPSWKFLLWEILFDQSLSLEIAFLLSFLFQDLKMKDQILKCDESNLFIKERYCEK